MINNPNTLPPAVQAYADDMLLSIKTPELIHSLGAQYRKIPAKSGNTWRGSRYDRLPTAPVPLGPTGATPPPTALNRTDIDAKIEFYGKQILGTVYAVVKSVLIDLEAYGAIALG